MSELFFKVILHFIIAVLSLIGIIYYINQSFNVIDKAQSSLNQYEETVKDCFYQNIKTKECEYILWKESHKCNC